MINLNDSRPYFNQSINRTIKQSVNQLIKLSKTYIAVEEFPPGLIEGNQVFLMLLLQQWLQMGHVVVAKVLYVAPTDREALLDGIIDAFIPAEKRKPPQLE